jgi:hypothetical protein
MFDRHSAIGLPKTCYEIGGTQRRFFSVNVLLVAEKKRVVEDTKYPKQTTPG